MLVPLSTVSRKEVPDSVLCNKLHRLSLATFDEEGESLHFKLFLDYLLVDYTVLAMDDYGLQHLYLTV